VGKPAGQHAEGRAPLDPRPCPGDRAVHLGDPSLVQLWGPRYSTYVVAARDLAVFTVGRLPGEGGTKRTAEDLAARLRAHLGGARMTYGEAGTALGEHPNRLRYAALTGTVVMRWDGARQPIIWTLPPPEIDPRDALLDLARRYLHVFGPTTPGSFAGWAGVSPRRGTEAFDALGRSLTPARTPVGDAWILSSDVPAFRAAPRSVAPARLLPSGDAYFLLQGADRELLVPDAGRRGALWTPRVWPGALLVEGELVGTWRRAQGTMTIETWRVSRPRHEMRSRQKRSPCTCPVSGMGSSSAVSNGIVPSEKRPRTRSPSAARCVRQLDAPERRVDR
jgi:hypothetical protein